MINLFKADLYRLRRNKTLIGGVIICLIFVFSTIATFSESDQLNLFTQYIDGKRYGFIVDNVKSNPTLFGFYQSFINFSILCGILQLFIITNLTIDRYRLGTFKNILSYGHSRPKIYLSNLMTIFTSLIILFLVTAIASLVVWCFIAPPTLYLSSTEIQLIVITTAVLLLILFAMASVYTFPSTLIKRKTVIVGIGILYFVYLSGLFLQLLPQSVLNKIPLFMLMNVCGSLVESQSQLGYYAWMSALIIAITSGLGILIFKKQELK